MQYIVFEINYLNELTLIYNQKRKICKTLYYKIGSVFWRFLVYIFLNPMKDFIAIEHRNFFFIFHFFFSHFFYIFFTFFFSQNYLPKSYFFFIFFTFKQDFMILIIIFFFFLTNLLYNIKIY